MAASTFFGVLHCLLVVCIAAQMDDQIVVIGAGISGLWAASELSRLGFSNILMLEARDRVGGRTHTDTSSFGAPMDLGASWIHGITNNPVHQLALDAGIVTVPFQWGPVTYDEHGQAIYEGSDTLFAMQDDEKSVLDAASKYANKFDDDINLQKAIDASISRVNRSYPQYVPFMLQNDVVEELAADTRNLSAWWWDIGDDLIGGDHTFKAGYIQLIDWITSKVKHAGVKLELSSEVSAISYHDGGATISTASGKSYEARRVVVTLPLGVLKAKAHSIFNPSLPEAKMRSISRLCVGTLNKVVLQFPSAFWNTSWASADLIQIDHPRWTTILFPNKWLGSEGSWILATTTGSHAVQIETMPEAEVVADLMTSIRVAYPTAPNPTKTLITRWSSDPFAFGSYSCAGVGTTPGDYVTLGASVVDTLFFAGEHTNKTHMATAHGALASGARAAAEVYALYKSTNRDIMI